MHPYPFQEDNPGDVTNEAEMLISAMENEAKAMQLDLSVAAVLFEKSKSPYAGGSFVHFPFVL